MWAWLLNSIAWHEVPSACVHTRTDEFSPSATQQRVTQAISAAHMLHAYIYHLAKCAGNAMYDQQCMISKKTYSQQELPSNAATIIRCHEDCAHVGASCVDEHLYTV